MFRSKSVRSWWSARGGRWRGIIPGARTRGVDGNGFWSELMRMESKGRKEVLVHSKSVNVPAPADLGAARN